MAYSHPMSGSRCSQVPDVANELANVPALCDDEALIHRLKQYNHTGRASYPACAI